MLIWLTYRLKCLIVCQSPRDCQVIKKALLMSHIDLSDNSMKRSSTEVTRLQEPQRCHRKEP